MGKHLDIGYFKKTLKVRSFVAKRRTVINKINAHYRKLKLRNIFNLELSKVEHMHFSEFDEERIFREFV